ncbi:MAG: large subunit ribosomal protein L6 [Candidatus Deianiraeaceae bacterium]|jgi:large subunit ribosomal protein L6
MSKIARLPITVPNDIKLLVADNKKLISIESKNAKIDLPYHTSINMVQDGGTVSFQSDGLLRNRTTKSVVGTVYATVKRTIVDIQNKFAVKLTLKGVGYKSSYDNQILSLSLGFSHPVKIAIPKDIEVKVTQNTIIELFGYNRRNVMDVATSIRSLRKPEPYKGKGIFINNETITLKEGKKK